MKSLKEFFVGLLVLITLPITIPIGLLMGVGALVLGEIEKKEEEE